jgi:ADP-ribose pyrophosphatase YjhB (NUDIX family)
VPKRKARLVARVVVRRGSELLVARHRRDTGEEYWCLPGGALKEGETFADAALRETAEEAGLGVELDGVVWVNDQLADLSGSSRLELFFAARATGTVPRPPANDKHLTKVAWRPLDLLAGEDFRPADFLAALRRGPLPALPRRSGAAGAGPTAHPDG